MGELTNTLRKTYASLASTKGRCEHSLFMAQGTKCVLDTLGAFEVEVILATSQWLELNKPNVDSYSVMVVKQSDIDRISTLSTPPEVIAIYRIPDTGDSKFHSDLILALDGIQDPGNLGTIIRVADWMGVSEIIASPSTVDVWNPKVIQATMGAISRVRVKYAFLPETLDSINLPIFGTFLEGENIFTAPLSPKGIIIMGNEGKGITSAVSMMVDHRLLIPSFPPDRPTSESLNVAVATAITLAEFRRRLF